MAKSEIFRKGIERLPEMFPEMNRRWRVTVFRNESTEGGIKNTVVERYENVRSKWTNGDILNGRGTLVEFIDANGKEVVVSALLPFLAEEITRAESENKPS